MSLNNQKRRYFLKFLAGAPGIAFMPPLLGLSLTGCGSDSSNPTSDQYIKNADEAATLVLKMAQEANRQGTFGVGGAIIENDSGRVIMAMHNKVLQPLGNNLGQFMTTVQKKLLSPPAVL